MSFLTDLPQDLDLLFADVGETITYTPSNGDEPIEILGIVTHQGDLEEDQNWGQSLEMLGHIRLKVSDVPTPQYNDSIEIDGETWHVIRRLRKAAGLWILEMKRDIRPVFNRGK